MTDNRSTLYARFATPFAEVHAAPLALVLLSFNYGAFLLAGLIACFISGGLSEQEEWRVFIIGWLAIPPLSLAAVCSLARLKQTRYADVESFYPVVLGANALLWVSYFAYYFPPPWRYDYECAPETLYLLVALLPLVNLLALGALALRRAPLVGRSFQGVYTLLPLAALYIGVNFSGLQGERPEPLQMIWPTIDLLEGQTGSAKYKMVEGQTFHEFEVHQLRVKMICKQSNTVQIPLPWPLASRSRLVAWQAAEGEWIEADRVFAVFESEFLRTEIRSRIPLQLKKKDYQPNEEAESTRPLGWYIRRTDAPRTNPAILYAALVLGLVPLIAARRKWPSFPRVPPTAVDLTALLGIALLVFDGAYLFEPHHYNFYLGPVNDVLRGKSLLVDVNCQYGVGVIYFLALLFKLLPIPLNYQGLSLLLSTLLIAQYALSYLLMRHLFRLQSLAIAALLLMIATGYFSQPEANLPSTGPLRFGLPYILIGLFAFRDRLGPWAQPLTYALVGLASLWSFETFTYTLATYLCAEGYALLSDPQPPKRKLRRLWSLVLGPGAAVTAGHLLLALLTYLRAGVWPDWSHYLDYVALYSVDEFGTMTIETWRPWALFIAVYFLSLILLLYKAPAATRPFATIAGLTGLGIVQFTYFLGRSHHNTLYFISIPLILVATFWFLYLQRDVRRVPAGFARTTAYCYFVTLFVLLAKAGPEFAAKWPRSPLHALLYTTPSEPSPWSAFASHAEVREALVLIERYANDKERVALFLHPGRTTETLMLSQKTHVFPLSNPRQDDLVPAAHARALAYEHGMQAGNYLFVTRRTHLLNGIQSATLSKLLEELQGQYADSTENVYAIRLFTP